MWVRSSLLVWAVDLASVCVMLRLRMEAERDRAKSTIGTIGVSGWRSTDSLRLEGRGCLEFEPVFNGIGFLDHLVSSLKRAALDSKGALWESLALTISSMVGICSSSSRARLACLQSSTLFSISAGDSGGLATFSGFANNSVAADLFESWRIARH